MLWWPLVIAAISGAVYAYIALTGTWETRFSTVEEDGDPTGFAIPTLVYGGGCLVMLVFFVLANWFQIAALF